MSIYEDGVTAAKALAEYTEKYSYMILEIRRLCVQTLAMGFEEREKYDKEHGGHTFVTPDAELKGQESMAYMILDELELEVDHWFCGTPILRDKGDE